MRTRLPCDVVVGVFKVVWIRLPLEVDVKFADVAIVPVPPRFAVGAALESPEAPAEVVFGWFGLCDTSSGCSKRPRSKDMVMDRVALVVSSLAVDFNIVEC